MPALILAALLAASAQDPAAPAAAQENPPSAASEPKAHAWPGFGFDRVDLLSEDPGTFLHYDAPLFRVEIAKPALRFVEQLKLSLRLPVPGLYLGLSIATQTLSYEYPVGPRGLYLTAGLQTRLLFPSGALAGIAYRVGAFRFGLSVSALTGGSWTAMGVNGVQWLPTFGFGIGAPAPDGR